MRIAAHLHPQVLDPEIPPVALRPEDVGAPFVHRHDVLVADVGADPFLLPPDPGAVGPGGALVAVVEQLHPLHRAPLAQGLAAVLDLQQVAARRTVVDRLPDGVIAPAARRTAKRGVIGTHDPFPFCLSLIPYPLSLVPFPPSPPQPPTGAAVAAVWRASNSASERPMRIGSTPRPFRTSTVL